MILVTGGAGFIGSHLVERLLQEGEEVHIFENFDPYYEARIKWRNIAHLLDNKRVRLHTGDIRDASTFRRAVSETPCEAVIHLAARAGVRASLEDPATFASVNVLGTQVVLKEATEAGVERFVVASSSSVYGDTDKLPLVEDSSAASEAASPYGATKRATEELCATHARLTGARVKALRFFTVYGPRQRPDMAIHKFARLIQTGQPLPLFGDGSSMRDYTFMDDIVTGIVASLRSERPGYRAYNLGRGQTVRLGELVDSLMQALGKRVPIEHGPEATGDVRATWADISRAREELGYEPKVSLDAGLEAFVNWYRSGPTCAG